MRYAVVTTFNGKGLKKYGQRMLDSYGRMWPKDVILYAYAEDCNPNIESTNIIVRDLHQSSKDLVAFKTKWKDVPKANGIPPDEIKIKRRDWQKEFKWDAVRFAHKVYSIFHCAKNCDAEYLLWMDADMYCHSPMKTEILDRLIPDNRDLCYIGREKKWPECGLYSINLKTDGGRLFLSNFQKVYDDAENGIFKMEEWHDSYVFEEVRQKTNLRCLDWAKGIVVGEGHPLINSEWGAYLDHLKGGRKELGKSLKRDLLTPRDESYWRSL